MCDIHIVITWCLTPPFPLPTITPEKGTRLLPFILTQYLVLPGLGASIDCQIRKIGFPSQVVFVIKHGLRRILCRYFRSSCSWLWPSSLSLRSATACRCWREETTKQMPDASRV